QEQKFTKTSTEQKPQEKPEDKPVEKPENKPEEKPTDKPEDKKPEEKPQEPEQPSNPEEKPQDQALWRQERLKPQSNKDIDLSNFDMDTPLSEKEKELVKLINDYRISLGKRPLNVSKSLTYVARTHTKDQILHFEYDLKDERGLPANLHSWSKYGNWTPVMYTADHKYGALTRKKPKELTQYNFGGGEISTGQQNYDQVHQITPTVAFTNWKNSPGHNEYMIEENALYDVFHADQIMGVSIHDGFANVWFGENPTDPAGFHITYEK
ncbi:CAP domain-containing protein, partial [Finegoldia magna]|uniref:CAP domain-containing protein n=1 Tax=Finegoldia magna TaxID=1260 RepID=UPI00399976D0